jgi:hypothetical protein
MTFNTNPYQLITLEILQAMLHFSGRAFVDSNLGRRDYGGEPLTGASPTVGTAPCLQRNTWKHQSSEL